MKLSLHHTAFSVSDLEWHVRFFETVFNMTIQKQSGAIPQRKLWFDQGIQLIETQDSSEYDSSAAPVFNHVAFRTDQADRIVSDALSMGCVPVDGQPHWFTTPSGITIELLVIS